MADPGHSEFVRILDGNGQVVSSFGGSGGVSHEDGSAFTVDGDSITPIGGIYEDTPSSLSDGQAGIVRLTANREMRVSPPRADNTDATSGVLLAGVGNYWFSGTSWNRARGDTTNGLDVDVTRLPTAVQSAFATIDTTPLLRVAIFDDDDTQITSFGGGGGGSGDASLAEQQAQTALLTSIDADTSDIHTNSDAMVTALQIIDDWDESDRAKVNLIAGQAGITAGAGAVAANTPRVTHASDDPVVTALQILDNIVAGSEAQVDVVASLPAGTNNIGDVDVASIANGSLNGPGAPTIDSYTSLAINLAAGANQVLVSSASNKQIWVYGIGFIVNVDGTVSFQDEDDAAITGVMPYKAGTGMSHSPSGNFAMPMWKLGTNKDLEVDIVTCEVDGWLEYAIVSV